MNIFKLAKVDALHKQNTDTLLAKGTQDEVSASRLKQIADQLPDTTNQPQGLVVITDGQGGYKLSESTAEQLFWS